jgi:hypothetical protein
MKYRVNYILSVFKRENFESRYSHSFMVKDVLGNQVPHVILVLPLIQSQERTRNAENCGFSSFVLPRVNYLKPSVVDNLMNPQVPQKAEQSLTSSQEESGCSTEFVNYLTHSMSYFWNVWPIQIQIICKTKTNYISNVYILCKISILSFKL